MSVFDLVPLAPPNNILGLALECKQDPFPTKIDLTIGKTYNIGIYVDWVIIISTILEYCIVHLDFGIIEEIVYTPLHH